MNGRRLLNMIAPEFLEKTQNSLYHIMHATKPIPTTAEILIKKYLGRPVDETWAKWAMDMMVAGFNSEHLVELAGLEKPYYQFELNELTNKVFAELGLEYRNEEKVVTQYAAYACNLVLNDKSDLFKTLLELKELCIEPNYSKVIYDFYTLYFAKDFLTDSPVQHYWEGATRDNIDEICLNYFKKWVEKYGPAQY